MAITHASKVHRPQFAHKCFELWQDRQYSPLIEGVVDGDCVLAARAGIGVGGVYNVEAVQVLGGDRGDGARAKWSPEEISRCEILVLSNTPVWEFIVSVAWSSTLDTNAQSQS